MNLWRALLIGTSQGIALVPGISRIGVTLATGLLLGIAPQKALRYSFFLAVPTILMAVVYKSVSLPAEWNLGVGWPWIGFLTSVLIGLLAIEILHHSMLKGKLHFFSIYLVIAAVTGLVYF